MNGSDEHWPDSWVSWSMDCSNLPQREVLERVAEKEKIVLVMIASNQINGKRKTSGNCVMRLRFACSVSSEEKLTFNAK